MKIGAFDKKGRKVFLIKAVGKLEMAEEVFALRCFLIGFKIYSKSPKLCMA
jgi:hypothetical protein